MYEIVDEIRAGKYILLLFDRPITERAYRRVEIDGVTYKLVPCYDTPPGVAIESNISFVGKKARLVM